MKIIITLIIILLFVLLHVSNHIETFDNTQRNHNIPLNIYQYWHTKELPPKMQECIDLLKRNNPEFKHYLYDNNDCRNYIDEFFDKDVLNAYDSLIPYSYKSDLWRYCVMYNNGGIYLDTKLYNIAGFNLIEMTDKEYFFRDIISSGHGVITGFFICKPNNPKLLNCINKIVENVKNNFYGNICLDPTGPMLLKKMFTEDELNKMMVGSFGEDNCPTNRCIYINDVPKLAFYTEYRDEQLVNDTIETNYSKAWSEHAIYKST